MLSGKEVSNLTTKLMHKQLLLIDTDPGHDDAMAIMLMVQSGLFEIKALTTVAGNSTIQNVTRNAAFILELLRRGDLPVYSGADKPLKRSLVTAVVHGESGLSGIDTSGVTFKLTNDASDSIIKLVDKYPGEITILALGPLTNIAQAFLQDPKLPNCIREIVIMGGAVDVPGNKNRVAEFNMFVDPEAADIVFRSPVKKTLIPLDVCNKTGIDILGFEKIKNQRLREPILAMMSEFSKALSEEEGTEKALVYDAVACYYLINSNAFKTEDMDIIVETKGEYTSGMTVAERRPTKEKMYNVTVVRDIDVATFQNDLIEIIGKDL